MLLNLHTHLLKKQDEEQIIFNEIIPDTEEALENLELTPSPQWLSVGIHPWYISPTQASLQLKKLGEVVQNEQVKLIGECGLDRMKGAVMPLQEEIFIKQIRLAEDLRKPLVIHCLRCFNELLSIQKIVRPKVPMVVHGFNNNIIIARQLLEKGFYLSLGAAILRTDSNAYKVLQEIPLEQLFFETDDTDIPLINIYEQASAIKNIAIEKLAEQIQHNYLNMVV